MKDEFCTDIRKFAEKVCQAVSVSLGDCYQVKLQEVIKNNGVVLQGLVILEENQNISPTIYLNSFLKMYERGSTLQEVVRQVLRVYREDTPLKTIDMSFFQSFGQVRDKICYRLINREKNQALLERIPHVDFLDLAICFFYSFRNEQIGNGTILIYNNHMEMWGSSTAELMRLAQQNTPRLYPYRLHSVESILKEMLRSEQFPEEARQEEMSQEEKINMYVLTNSGRIQGAACILYPEVLRELSDKLDGNFYILPSSVHEVILIPARELQSPAELRSIICEVNSTQVEPEEILSDNLYFFNASKTKITIE